MAEEKALDWMDSPDALSEEEFDALREDPAFRRACKDIMACRQAVRQGGKSTAADTELAWQRFQARLPQPKVRRHYWLGVMAGVAASVLLMLAWWGVSSYLDSREAVQVFAANEKVGEIVLQDGSGQAVSIGPGTQEESLAQLGATLTQMDDTLGLAYVTSTDMPVETHVLSTPRGKDFKLVLADGTTVWLNAESRLEYPSRFTGDTRTVRLRGEAYFQVAHNEQMPFVVETECVQTRVLGTEFNLCGYTPADTHVTLIKGSVEVKSPHQAEAVRMVPGEDAHLQSDGSFALCKVDVDAYIYWKEGFFYFDNTELADIMQTLGRWYNVNVVFRHKKAMTYKMHYFCDRKKDIAHAVELLNMMGKVTATVEGQTVYVD